MRERIGAAVLAAVVLICMPGAKAQAATEPTLEQIRTATEKYRDVKVALADGYVAAPANSCETAEMMGRPASDGAMGIHYFRPDLLGIKGPPNPRVVGDGTHTDWLQPGILLYEPQADGSLQLVGIENLVFAKAWHGTGHKDRPSFMGRPYEHMVDDPATKVDEAHMFEEHYDRHVWLYRTNPNGMFTPFNPNVSCRHGKGPASHAGH